MRVLVLLGLCLNFHTCGSFPNRVAGPDPFPDYDLAYEDPGGTWNRTGCGPCEPEQCPDTRGCRAGPVQDPCGCCQECGNLEGQACDPGPRGVHYGLCGTGMRCQADPRPAGGPGPEEEGEEEEEVCVCLDQDPVCGTDGTTYLNRCQFREAAFSQPDLRIRGKGPCKTVPVIKVPPRSRLNASGSSVAFGCEVFAFPMATVEWRKEGRAVVLPGDDPHVSVQSRGGPLKFEVSSWLQIERAGPEDSGTYHCTARNDLGSVSASAVLGILGVEELSSYLANSVAEMKQLMDGSDYDRGFY